MNEFVVLYIKISLIVFLLFIVTIFVINKLKKPYLFWYWEGEKKKFINLCYETVKKNCSESFNIVTLDNFTIHKWLPDLKKYKKHLDKLMIAQRVDIYRIMLLEKYGGLYIDADILVLKNPIEIINKLDKYNFVGFGCTGIKCKYGYKQPSNAIMASRPHTRLMKNILKEQLHEIQTKDNFEYFDLGKYVIWKYIGDYYHYENKYDGTRDKYGNWITNKEIFSDVHIEYDDVDNMLFLEMYNSNLTDEINNMTYDQLINGNTNFANFYNLAMK